MPKPIALKPETIREIIALANDMTGLFAPPEYIPGCLVNSVADKDEYATDNGWIEAVCGKHNQQRCRWRGQYSGVAVNDYVDVIYFKSFKLFAVLNKGGTGASSFLPLTTKGDLLTYSTVLARLGVGANDTVLTADSTQATGLKWATASTGWPYSNVLTVDPSDPDADYSTITSAIAGASAGDTLLIGNGTYSESITVNKKLYLVGVSREGVIITHNATNGFTTTTADCVIENLTIQNTTGGSAAVAGILVQADVTYRNVLFDFDGITSTVVSSVVGISNSGAYTVILDDCNMLYGDASSSVLIGVYLNHAGAVATIISGSITNTASGGNIYDLYANAGTVNILKTRLGDNGIYTGGTGVYNGNYYYNYTLYRANTQELVYSLKATSVANDIFNIQAASDSDFVATIATLPGGAVLTYNAPLFGDENNLVPNSTSHIAKMVLHNTTDSTDALISNCVSGTNTITLTDNVPGTWAVTDTITIRSQTNTSVIGSRYFVDFEFVSDIETDSGEFIAYFYQNDSGGLVFATVHPYEANAASKRFNFYTQVIGTPFVVPTHPIAITSSRFCVAWQASGTGTLVIAMRLFGEGQTIR